MNRCAWPSRMAYAVTLLAGVASGEDGFLSRWQDIRNRQPEGVSLVLSAPNRALFLGETIPIELRLTATKANKPNTFQLWTPSADESFIVDPAGIVDDVGPPRRSGFGHLSPGPFYLSEKPYSIRMDLNDAVRFRQPAMYRIYVLSRRVRQVLDSAGTEPRMLLDSHSSPVELVSNILTLEVRSAPEAWVKDRIDSALRTLRDPGSNASERTAARRELLFLNTREAAIELANHLGEDALEPGMAYSDYRKEILAVMEQRLVAPDQPVTGNYLDTLAAMAVLERPSDDPKRVWEVREQKRNEYATKLFAEVMSKQPGARAVCASTLLETGTRMGRPEPWLRGIAAWVTANFRSLPDYVQYRLLAGSAWQVLKGPLMVPVLRDVCDSPNPAYPLAYQAVHNLFEIAPNEGRAAIIADIRRPKSNFQFNWLAELPIGALPEADEALVARALPGDWHSDNLIARFATGAIAQGVEDAYTKRDEHSRNCISPVLFYFLRHDPAFAERELRRIFSTKPAHFGCWSVALQAREVASYAMSPALERLAIENLSSGVVVIKDGFAQLLGQYGSAAAKQPLWDTMVYFRSWWKGHEEDLKLPINKEGRQFERTLLNALMGSHAWSLTTDEFERLLALCSSDECKTVVTRRLRSQPTKQAVAQL